MATKKTTKKKAAPKPSNGAAELAAYAAAVKALREAGASLKSAAKANKGFAAKSTVQRALQSAVDVATRNANMIPPGPPPTTPAT